MSSPDGQVSEMVGERGGCSGLVGAGHAPSPQPPGGLPRDNPGRTLWVVGRRMGGQGAPENIARSGDARLRRWRSGPTLVECRTRWAGVADQQEPGRR